MNGLNDIVGQDAKEAGKWFSRPNLFINPDFTNPVNQRGLTEYSEAGYTIDMWKLAYTLSIGTVTLTANGMSLWHSDGDDGVTELSQTLENPPKGIVTASLLTSDNQLISGTGILGELVHSVGDLPIITTTQNSVRIWWRSGSRLTLIAAKLEKGIGQTLAHKENGVWVQNRTTRYEDELRRCQAYQFSVRPENWTGHIIVGKGLVTSETVALVDVNLPVSLRGNPKPIWSGDFVLSHSGGYGAGIKVTDIQFDGRSQNGVSLKVTTAGGLKVGNAVRMIGNRDNGSMLLLDTNP